jgi:hypothetical protein
MSDLYQARNPQFDLKLIARGLHWVIEVKCKLCESTFVGNVSDGLVGWETNHVQSCPAMKQAPVLKTGASL